MCESIVAGLPAHQSIGRGWIKFGTLVNSQCREDVFPIVPPHVLNPVAAVITGACWNPFEPDPTWLWGDRYAEDVCSVPHLKQVDVEVHHAPTGKLILRNFTVLNAVRQNIHAGVDGVLAAIAECTPIPVMRGARMPAVNFFLLSELAFHRVAILVAKGNSEMSELGKYWLKYLAA